METKHTPGPWKLASEKNDSYYGFKQVVSEPTGWFIADIAGNSGLASIPTIESEANAKLISAAPDMLDALESIRGIEAWINDAKMKELFQLKVYSAIQKATE